MTLEEAIARARDFDIWNADGGSLDIILQAAVDGDLIPLPEVQKMRAALSDLNDKDMCQMGQAPCDWALRLIAEKEAAEAEVARLREALTILGNQFEYGHLWAGDSRSDVIRGVEKIARAALHPKAAT